jgi:tetratricopeptide (TPR) repeat protein
VDVYVSGVAARAVFVKGVEVTYIDAERPDNEKRAKDSDLRYLLADAPDVECIRDTDWSEGVECLLRKCTQDRALRMLDIAVDPELEEFGEEGGELAISAKKCLDQYLGDPSTIDLIENVAFSQTLPDGFKIKEDAHPQDGTQRAERLIQSLAASNETIARVRSAWQKIASLNFEDEISHRRVEYIAVREGIFRQFALAAMKQTNVDSAKLRALTALSRCRNHRQIIDEWISNLNLERSRTKILINMESEQEADDFSDYIDTPFETAHAHYSNVKPRINAIVVRLERRDEINASKYARELTRDQVAGGNAKYAAKSLCNLAQEAKHRGMTSLQLEWVNEATRLAPEDPWTFAQAGDAYLSLYRLQEADEFFERTIKMGDPHYGLVGRARVLMASNKLDEALAAFNEIKNLYPHNRRVYWSWLGMGRVLRAMGEPNKALTMYEEAKAAFPDQSEIFCGWADTLVELNKLQEALAAFTEIGERFPKSSGALAGKGEVLSLLGRFSESLDVYSEVIGRFPTESIGYTGTAYAQRESGNYQEALNAYNAAIKRFEFDPYAYAGRAQTLKDMNQFQEALEAYESAIAKFTHESYLRNGRASALKAMGRLEEALQAYDSNVNDFPYNLGALTGRAQLLRELGKSQDALIAFDTIINRRPDYNLARISKAAILTVLKKFDEAIDLLPNGEPVTRDEWVGQHIRGIIFLRTNKTDLAIEIFENGAKHCPFHRSSQYFYNGVALGRIQRNQYAEAMTAALAGIGPTAKLLSMHSSAELGQIEVAKAQFNSLKTDNHPNIIVLKEEIARRYGLQSGKIQHDDAWIKDKETELLLAFAA